MQPNNPIVGGVVLRRAAIQSPNFISGSTGWTINADGSAEFNSLALRGIETLGNPASTHIILDGTTGLIGSYDSSNNIRIILGGGELDLLPPTIYGLVWTTQPGKLLANLNDALGNANGVSGYCSLISPVDATAIGVTQKFAILQLNSRSHDNTTTPSQIIGSADSATLPPIFLNNSAPTLPATAAPGAETWHSLTLVNNFSNAGAGFPVFSYRLVASPPNTVELVGTIKSGVTVASGTQIATLPTGYRPITQQGFTARNFGANGPLEVVIETSGAVELFGVWTNGAFAYINGRFPLDL